MRKILLAITIVIFATSCSKKDATPATPTKASLTFPANNETCTQGTSTSDVTSTILFKWSAASNTDSYELHYKNLLTGAENTQNATQAQAEVILYKATPYSWYVISKSTKTTETAQSDTWKFYNAGSGIKNYAPFPADITAPVSGQNLSATNGKITLKWTGSDVDNDIVEYDVYFGTTATPALLKSKIKESSLADVSVVAGTIYYWKVISRDSQGNTSDSGLFQFKVN
jgi:hypothetical protein